MIQITLPVRLPSGTIFKTCTIKVCTSYKVLRSQRARAGFVHQLAEVAGSLALDPLIVEYDALIKAGESKKQAALSVRRKFGGRGHMLSRSQFFKRLAAR